ncbi:MAG: tripartite tricarboxylate transporter substrate binding protein [Betaproteobacteria bacterium]|nr:tripartite tricarboxylate transporter substrate binding protein [Betaproteobacteria bacterium]
MFTLVLLCAALAGFAGGAAGQTYPSKPIRFIVPFAPGGGTDIVARIIGQKLNDTWGPPVVVDNRPGAGSAVGTGLAAEAPADGYTIVMSSIALAINATLRKKLSYDTLRDFAPVTLVASQPNILVVNPALPVKSVNYASGGNGTGPHLATELLKLLAGIDITHVPYKGNGPALTDLLGGQVQMMMSVMAAAQPFVKAGKLRALAVTGAARSPVAPGIPTLAEAGVTGYEFITWYGVQVPAKTPPPIINRLNSEITRILQLPDVRERFAAGGLDPVASTPEEFGALIRSEIVKWAKVVKATGATAQ